MTAPVSIASKARLPSAIAQGWLLVGMTAAVALVVVNTISSSVLIDGVRWFWLDDDMMISMRYARNLVEGHGLVWNPGELVEGYTNFGWVMLMSAVHLLPLPDRLMAVAMKVVSTAILLATLIVAARLLRTLEPKHLNVTLPVVLVLMLTCRDIMFWAASGFETILVTLLHLLVVWRIVAGRRLDAWVLVPLALLPLVRSDGLSVWLGDAALALWLASDRKQTALFLSATLLPLAAHLGFRLAYYGDLLPNTYYLKLDGLDHRYERGFAYVVDFAGRYALVLLLAAATVASLWRQDVRTRSFVTSIVPAVLYAWSVGGDNFTSARFFAHVMPELFIWTAVGGVTLVTTRPASAAWLLAPVVVLALPGLRDPLQRVVPATGNGMPYVQTIVAAELLANASPNASVAVIPAGIVPYFTRLRSVDLLGKTDAYIARLPPRAGAILGHGKFDPAYSFGKAPDYMVSLRSDAYSTGLSEPERAPDFSAMHPYAPTLLASPEFQFLHKPNPVPDPYLQAHSAVYVRSGSPEIAKLATWWGVVIE